MENVEFCVAPSFLLPAVFLGERRSTGVELLLQGSSTRPVNNRHRFNNKNNNFKIGPLVSAVTEALASAIRGCIYGLFDVSRSASDGTRT